MLVYIWPIVSLQNGAIIPNPPTDRDWETHFAKLPKYIQANCTFIYIGNRLPSKDQKHYEVPWVGEVEYQNGEPFSEDGLGIYNSTRNEFTKGLNNRRDARKKLLDFS